MNIQTLACLLASAGLITVSHAATIAWTSKPFTGNGTQGANIDTGIIATTGTLVYAENTGGSAQTFDGINFNAGTINFGGTANVFFATQSQLVRDGTFGSAGVANTVTLGTGSLPTLTIGQEYQVQLLVFDGRNTTGQAGRYIRVDGTNMGVYANGVTGVTWGPGLLVTGTFVADATTQSFTMEAFNANNTSAGGQLNALVLHAIPEPSVALLGGLGVLGLLRRRRN